MYVCLQVYTRARSYSTPSSDGNSVAGSKNRSYLRAPPLPSSSSSSARPAQRRPTATTRREGEERLRGGGGGRGRMSELASEVRGRASVAHRGERRRSRRQTDRRAEAEIFTFHPMGEAAPPRARVSRRVTRLFPRHARSRFCISIVNFY